jgi:hypothetical protein
MHVVNIQLPALQFFRAEGFTKDAALCTVAARAGNVECLRSLHELGYNWNDGEYGRISSHAAAGGSAEVLAYLQQHGVVLTAEKLTDLLNTAGAAKKPDAAKWLRQQGAEWPPVLKWPRKMVAWARANGCTSPTQEST